MMKTSKTILLLLLCTLLFGSCRSSRSVQPEDNALRYLSSKLQITVPYQGDIITLPGTVKMISGECIQLSLLMPMFHSEIVRIDITPDEVLFVDRMNRRYVRATWPDINALLTRKVNYRKIEKLLYNASLQGTETVITAKDLNLKAPDAVQLRLYEFSTAELTIPPTGISSEYQPLALDKLLKLMLHL